jgi:hypothetical protein
MMVMMVFRTQGLLPVRRARFREADLARAEADRAEIPVARTGVAS